MIAGCILALLAQRSFGRAGDRDSAVPGPAARAPSRQPGPPTIPDTARSTRSGAYTVEQATSGKELYILNCVSCHTAVTHTGPAFVDKWEGRPLWELYQYMSESMPKSEPGSLTPGEYSRVLAYMLQMNGAPAGTADLRADSTALKQIRIELKPR